MSLLRSEDFPADSPWERPVEPPMTDELPEMIQRASEIDDPTIYRLCDVIIRNRRRQKMRRCEFEPDPAA